MEYTPDMVFMRMRRRRRPVVRIYDEAVPQTVYVPQNVRSGSYQQLMRSHDRMGTRHLV